MNRTQEGYKSSCANRSTYFNIDCGYWACLVGGGARDTAGARNVVCGEETTWGGP